MEDQQDRWLVVELTCFVSVGLQQHASILCYCLRSRGGQPDVTEDTSGLMALYTLNPVLVSFSTKNGVSFSRPECPFARPTVCWFVSVRARTLGIRTRIGLDRTRGHAYSIATRMGRRRRAPVRVRAWDTRCRRRDGDVAVGGTPGTPDSSLYERVPTPFMKLMTDLCFFNWRNSFFPLRYPWIFLKLNSTPFLSTNQCCAVHKRGESFASPNNPKKFLYF